jgi:peptidyl-prolyl cis-trans isomerase A (cyclophilin A)
MRRAVRLAAAAALAAGGLLLCGGCPLGAPVTEHPEHVRLTTSAGDIVLDLAEEFAPATTAGFRAHVVAGDYDGTIFHRVLPGFIIQGGGYTPALEPRDPGETLPLESGRGLQHLRGTVALVRNDDGRPTAQFFINLADNLGLNPTLQSPGYTVFGVVVQGIEVVDAIAAEPLESRGGLTNVPVVDVVIERAAVEVGPEQLTPEWDRYLRGVDYNWRNTVRNVQVSIVSWLLSRGT